MARRCGCLDSCNCSVIAGANVTVTGTGSADNPYIVSATGGATQVLDTSTVNMTITGTGTSGDPYVISAAAIVSAEAGNCLEARASGLFALCTSVVGVDTPCMDVAVVEGPTGTFSVSVTPIIAAEPNGLECSPSGLTVPPSSDAGNNLTVGTDGRLFVPTGAATVTTADTACIAVNGDGSGGSPVTAVPILAANSGLVCTPSGLSLDPGCGVELVGNEIQANVSAWPFACDQDTNATDVYCSPSDGSLQGPPEYKGRTVAAFTSSAPGVLAPGARVCVSASVVMDTTGHCENDVFSVSIQNFWDVTLNAGSDFNIQSERQLDGGATTVETVHLSTNSPNGHAEIDRVVSATDQGTITPGLHTLVLRTCIENTGPGNITVNNLSVAGRGLVVTAHT